MFSPISIMRGHILTKLIPVTHFWVHMRPIWGSRVQRPGSQITFSAKTYWSIFCCRRHVILLCSAFVKVMCTCFNVSSTGWASCSGYSCNELRLEYDIIPVQVSAWCHIAKSAVCVLFYFLLAVFAVYVTADGCFVSAIILHNAQLSSTLCVYILVV